MVLDECILRWGSVDAKEFQQQQKRCKDKWSTSRQFHGASIHPIVMRVIGVRVWCVLVSDGRSGRAKHKQRHENNNERKLMAA
jgi:hypothetical protein